MSDSIFIEVSHSEDENIETENINEALTVKIEANSNDELVDVESWNEEASGSSSLRRSNNSLLSNSILSSQRKKNHPSRYSPPVPIIKKRIKSPSKKQISPYRRKKLSKKRQRSPAHKNESSSDPIFESTNSPITKIFLKPIASLIDPLLEFNESNDRDPLSDAISYKSEGEGDGDIRHVHNEKERERRSQLKDLFEDLKRHVPATEKCVRASKADILREATDYCKHLTELDQFYLSKIEQMRTFQSHLRKKIIRLRQDAAI